MNSCVRKMPSWKGKTEKALVTDLQILVSRDFHLHPGNLEVEQAWTSSWALHVDGLCFVKSSRQVFFLIETFQVFCFIFTNLNCIWFEFAVFTASWDNEKKKIMSSFDCSCSRVVIAEFHAFLLFLWFKYMLEYLCYRLFF